MNAINKYMDLIIEIIDRVISGDYTEENYIFLHNKIVNQFAEDRLDTILNDTIEPKNIDVDDMLGEFKYKLEYPKIDNSHLSFSLRHILQDWSILGDLLFDGIDIKEIIKICKEKDIEIDEFSLIKYCKARNTIHLSKNILDKYEQLFKIYLTVDDSVMSSKEISNNTLNMIHRRIKIQSKISHQEVKKSMREIILYDEINFLNNICESTPINYPQTHDKNFIERLYLYNFLNNHIYYFEKYLNENDLWSLTVLSIFYAKNNKELKERPYISNDKYKNLNNLKELENVLYEDDEKKIDEGNMLYFLIKDLYEKWIKKKTYNWDNHWNKEIIKYINDSVKLLIEVNRRKLLTTYPSSEDKENKAQRKAYKITEEVIVSFAKMCEKDRYEKLCTIYEDISKKFDYKFTPNAVKKWLEDHQYNHPLTKRKRPSQIKKIITVDIARQWWAKYLSQNK